MMRVVTISREELVAMSNDFRGITLGIRSIQSLVLLSTTIRVITVVKMLWIQEAQPSEFTTISKVTKEIFVKICRQSEDTDSDLKVARCNMQISYLNALDFFFARTFANSLNVKRQYGKKCLGEE